MIDSGTPSSQRMMGISLSYDYPLERNVGAGAQLATHEKIIAPCVAEGEDALRRTTIRGVDGRQISQPYRPCDRPRQLRLEAADAKPGQRHFMRLTIRVRSPTKLSRSRLGRLASPSSRSGGRPYLAEHLRPQLQPGPMNPALQSTDGAAGYTRRFLVASFFDPNQMKGLLLVLREALESEG